ncbi:glutamate--tRNA ligase [Pelagibacterium sp. 26DY04]|uniref:glutamate--tRNA ligase n=1 Tax=Pelagibacterium sp. 26DY04 TaxID=2967130 RepID=UPI00281516F7|nr:glutamate--tRNA ligase [Pelagibacterium sp. 26DY04]WMT88132.1 glutamate--tRNA ligase [Pelagibacterium sp. 26DY04]
MSVTVRYAPSPTGRLHLGNARPAVLNWLFAKSHGGKFVLRLDDTDTARSTEEFAQGIETDLAWLGIAPDLKVRQSDRFGLYDAARDRLIAAGRLYPCYETADELDRKRKRARALGKPPIYDRAALNLSDEDKAKLEAEGRKPHWRFKLDGRPVTFTDLIKGEQTVNTASMSDPVLIREDGTYLYTLPSVVDDIDLGVTHVIRGEDHVSNTGTQIEIFEALGGAVPTFAHHNLLTDAEGQGFSKRLGSLSLAQLREEGYEPLAVAIVAALTGTSLPVEPYASLDAIAERLDFSMISHGSARFDPAELDTLNARLVHHYDFAAVRERFPQLEGLTEAAWLALRDNVSRLPELGPLYEDIVVNAKPVVTDEDRDFIATAREFLPEEPWDENTWGQWTGSLKQATGRKGKALFLPLRLALTGKTEGPELKALLPVLGRKASLARLS